MTPQEFKAWFEGFSEGIAERPTQKQWQRICQKVKQVDGTPIRYVEYVRQYWPAIGWDFTSADANRLPQNMPQIRASDISMTASEVLESHRANAAVSWFNGKPRVTYNGIVDGQWGTITEDLPTLQDLGRAEFAEVR